MMAWDLESGGSVTCRVPHAPPASVDHTRRDLSEMAARRPLHEVVRPVTVCVTAEMSTGDARRLLGERKTRALPVVDDEFRVVGILTRADLMGGPPESRVGDLMATRVFSIGENAPVSEAIATMAAEDVSEVPVVTRQGEIIGIWHALDAMRWTAERFGYVFPADRT
jgi:CBS domain-containing membrane protein